MIYTVEIVINKPVNEVVNLFEKQENMYNWAEGLQSIEPISGEPGEEGSKARLKFKMGKRKIEMIETIVSKNLPDEMTVEYEAKGVYNKVINRFLPIAGTHTKYITDQEFRFKGIMKLMALIMPGVFRKQSIKYLENFKAFVEKAES